MQQKGERQSSHDALPIQTSEATPLDLGRDACEDDSSDTSSVEEGGQNAPGGNSSSGGGAAGGNPSSGGSSAGGVESACGTQGIAVPDAIAVSIVDEDRPSMGTAGIVMHGHYVLTEWVQYRPKQQQAVPGVGSEMSAVMVLSEDGTGKRILFVNSRQG